MKRDPSFPNLPSIGELLKHPTVERIVDRVNQTTIAQRATGFLEELRSNLHRQSDRGVVPSIHQLAERLTRRLLGPTQHGYPVINATGAVWGDRWPAPPLADVAVHEMLRLASEYHVAENELLEQVTAALVDLTSAEAAWVGSSFESAASTVQTAVEGSVDLANYVGLTDPASFGLTHVDTIDDRLATGADVVVCDGAGILGGPRCGIVVGRRKQIEALKQLPATTTCVADVLTLAALDATLGIYRSQDRVVHQIPALQLLSTPLANLQQRCERLAPLIEESGAVAEALPTQCESAWYDARAAKYAGPTWALRLRPTADSVQDLAQLLHDSSPQVVGREQQDAIWLDMRAVFPRWDQQLVMAGEGRASSRRC